MQQQKKTQKKAGETTAVPASRNVPSAKDLLNDLEKLTMPLPRPEPEPALEETPRQEYERLNKTIKRAGRERAEALRLIRERKLYIEGNYTNFESYCAGEHGRTPAWASLEIHWLEVIELVEAKTGESVLGLSVDAAQELHRLIEYPNLFAQAYLEAKATGKVTQKIVKAAVEKQEAYRRFRQTYADLTYSEFEGLYSLGDDRLPLLDEAKTRDAAGLLALAKEAQDIPYNRELLEVARGDDLLKLVEALVPIRKERDEAGAKRRKIAELEQQLRTLKGTPPPKEEPGADQEEEEEDEEEEDEEGPKFKVTATGSFAGTDFYPQIGGEYDLEGLAGLFAGLGEVLEGGVWFPGEESTLTVTPVTQDEGEGEQ